MASQRDHWRSAGAGADEPPPQPGFAGWWARLRASSCRAVGEARRRWVQRGGGAAAPSRVTPPAQATTQRLRALGETDAVRPAFLVLWEDARWRRALLLGTLLLVVVVALAIAAPRLRGRLSRPVAPPAATPAQPGPTVQPAQPAQPGQPAQPPPEGQPPAQGQPAPAPAGRVAPTATQLGIAALPLLLGLFWLLSAWLVDTEARRAFVIQEPWGERRTFAYSCLAVGCVFPLILAGLIFSAYGFVQFVVYVANRQSWVAGIQAGALVLLVCALVLILRATLVRWRTSRQ